MKKSIFYLSALVVLIGATFMFSSYVSKDSTTTEEFNCTYGQCIKLKANGYQCGNCAQQYSSYCWSHNR